MAHSNSAAKDGTNAGTPVEDLRSLLREAEQALGNPGGEASDDVQALRERLRDVLADGQSTFKNLSESFRRQAARADEVVRANPYQTIGAAAGVGILLGILLHRSFGSRD
jgi:ElaB/YqjD/DUF883 family membrane-anchored ribosome-binding protein